MWWTSGVSSAIAACQQQKSVLIVLLEPASAETVAQPAGTQSSEQLLARLATASLHRVTFTASAIQDAIAQSKAVCLKLRDESTDADLKSFRELFTTPAKPPTLYFISPHTGAVLNLKHGFVPPSRFLEALQRTTTAVSGATIRVAPPPARHSAVVRARDLRAMHDASAETDGGSARVQQLHAPSRDAAMQLRAEDADGVQIVARLPDGAQVRREFASTTRFVAVRSWLMEEAASGVERVVVQRQFPRVVFDGADDAKMLAELGLTPSATLIVSRAPGRPADAPPLAAAREGVASYARAAWNIAGGFLRSFVAAPTGDRAPEMDGGEETARRQTAVEPRAQAVRMVQRRGVEDDENLLSNGNGVQFGWNSQDVDQD